MYERGLLFEHLIAHELYRRTGALWPRLALYHFRTRHGVEVDFVVQNGRELWGIEVKASGNIAHTDFKGLHAFANRTARVKRKIVVFLGPRKQQHGDVEVLPLRDFLSQLPGQL